MKRTSKSYSNLSNQLKRSSKRVLEEKENHLNKNDLIPMGSTLLNLAMSETIYGGAKKGTMVNIIGGSHGGKTMLALTSFAEANMKKSFNNYKFIYDDSEHANSFDMKYLFGEKVTHRIQPPRPEKSDIGHHNSETVQHFHTNVLHLINQNTPFIYVQDSFDALDALEDQKKVEEMAEAIEKDKKTAGTYGMAKAKGASALLRSITSKLASTKSALFIISQIRDNVDPSSFQKQTRSGGRALKFYASHEMWLTSAKAIKKKDTIIGSSVKVKITKNKLTGKVREITFDIYYDYGIDDIGSCIDYLIQIGRWSGGGSSKINHNNDFEFPNSTKPKLISLIEEAGGYQHLQRLVEEEWNKFENSLKLGRKKKYT